MPLSGNRWMKEQHGPTPQTLKMDYCWQANITAHRCLSLPTMADYGEPWKMPWARSKFGESDMEVL